MPLAPCGNSQDGLKDQVNIKLGSTGSFKESREVDELWLGRKKKKKNTSHGLKIIYYLVKECNECNCVQALFYYFCITEGFGGSSPKFQKVQNLACTVASVCTPMPLLNLFF